MLLMGAGVVALALILCLVPIRECDVCGGARYLRESDLRSFRLRLSKEDSDNVVWWCSRCGGKGKLPILFFQPAQDLLDP